MKKKSNHHHQSANIEPEYSSEVYWDERYKKVQHNKEIDSHEWYYSFEILCPLIIGAMKAIPAVTVQSSILEIGCGDRPLIDGFRSLTDDSINVVGKSFSLYAIDFSKSVIDALTQNNINSNHDSNQTIKSTFAYNVMDARQLDYSNNSFEFIMDKGTIDAMFCCKNRRKAISDVSKIISEAVRCLKSIGTLMIVSHISVGSTEFDVLIQEVIMPQLVKAKDRFWKIDAHVVTNAEGVDEVAPRSSARQKRSRDDDAEKSSFGTVYMISSSIRRETRHSKAAMSSLVDTRSFDVPLKVHEYEVADH